MCVFFQTITKNNTAFNEMLTFAKTKTPEITLKHFDLKNFMTVGRTTEV